MAILVNPVVINPSDIGNIFNSQPHKITKIVWDNPLSDVVIGDKVTLTDVSGAILWEKRISSYGPGVASGQLIMPPESMFVPAYVSHGFVVTALDHGRVYVYFSPSGIA